MELTILSKMQPPTFQPLPKRLPRKVLLTRSLLPTSTALLMKWHIWLSGSLLLPVQFNSLNWNFPHHFYSFSKGHKNVLFMEFLVMNLPKNFLKQGRVVSGGLEFSLQMAFPKWFFEESYAKTVMGDEYGKRHASVQAHSSQVIQPIAGSTTPLTSGWWVSPNSLTSPSCALREIILLIGVISPPREWQGWVITSSSRRATASSLSVWRTCWREWRSPKRQNMGLPTATTMMMILKMMRQQQEHAWRISYFCVEIVGVWVTTVVNWN